MKLKAVLTALGDTLARFALLIGVFVIAWLLLVALIGEGLWIECKKIWTDLKEEYDRL